MSTEKNYIEEKKSQSANLETRKTTWLLLGYIMVFAVLFAAFEWTATEKKHTGEIIQQGILLEEEIMVPITLPEKKVVPPPPQAKQITEILEIVEDDAPVLIAEEMPSFQGGDLNTFRNWVQSRLKYPQVALENNVQGQAVMSFVIERDGRLTGIQVLQAPDRSLGDEAARVLAMSPKWKPGKQRNSPVRVKYILPVVFKIQH